LSSAVTNTVNGQLRATNNGVVHLNGVAITGGTLSTNTGGRFTASSSSLNFLDNVTLNGAVDLAISNSALRVVNNLAFGSATVSINNGSSLAFNGNTATSGTGTITFGATGNNQVAVDVSNSTFTIGAGTLINGQNGSIGAQKWVGTAGSLVANNGIISADVNGGTVSLLQSAFSNNNILEARNGGTLNITSGVTNTVNGNVNATNNGVVLLNSAAMTGGTINTSAGGRFTATNANANFLNDVSVTGGIDLATTQGSIRVNGASGMTLLSGATVNLNNSSALAFQGAQALAGNGSVVFGATGINRVVVDGSGAVLTIGAGATIRGQSGNVGGQLHVVTANSNIFNNGKISADVNGGSIQILQATVTNNGVLEAKNGGTLVLSSNVTGLAGSQISAGAGSVVLQSGVTLSGVINSTGTG